SISSCDAATSLLKNGATGSLPASTGRCRRRKHQRTSREWDTHSSSSPFFNGLLHPDSRTGFSAARVGERLVQRLQIGMNAGLDHVRAHALPVEGAAVHIDLQGNLTLGI